MNRRTKRALGLLLLCTLAVAGFEYDRVALRPDRMTQQSTTQWRLDAKREACFARPDSLVIIGNSILHAVRDSLEELPGVAVWSVPGEYAAHLEEWGEGLAHPDIQVVAVALGANDLLAGFTPAELRTNYLNFRDQATAAGKYCYPLEVVPFELGWSPYVRPTGLDARRIAWNTWPEDASDEQDDARLFPTKTWSNFTHDGVHPNEKGRTLLVKFYKQQCGLD